MNKAIYSLLLRVVRNRFTALCLLLSCFSSGLAGVDICGQPAAYSHLSMTFKKQEKSSIERNIGEVMQENSNFDMLLRLRNDWSFGAGHQYTILNVDPLELQTNGHLHTYFFALHRHTRSDQKSVRFSIAPALSASSNVIKKPGEYKTDVLQVLAALVWSRQLSDRMNLRYGLCGDHRFGGYEIYPSLGVELRLAADWIVELGFPTSQLTHHLSRSLTSSLRIAPDGNEWYVEDKNLEKQSDVIYESWALEWAVEWQTHRHFMITAGIGRQFRNRYEMTLLDDSRVRLRSDPVTQVSAAVAWRF